MHYQSRFPRVLSLIVCALDFDPTPTLGSLSLHVRVEARQTSEGAATGINSGAVGWCKSRGKESFHTDNCV